MFTWMVLVYALGWLSIDLYLVAHRSRLVGALGPLFRPQLAIALLITLLGLAIVGEAFRTQVWAPARRRRVGALGRIGWAAVIVGGFALRLAGLTLFFYGLLALLCPFLPREIAVWYDPIVVAAAFLWILWWRAVKADPYARPRVPS